MGIAAENRQINLRIFQDKILCGRKYVYKLKFLSNTGLSLLPKKIRKKWKITIYSSIDFS